MNQRAHFVIAGGQRCGTTLLHQLLDAHPDIRMARPTRPEPKFFLQAGGSYQDYLARHFADARDREILGEKSTSYYEVPAVARRIRALIPACRILFLLRDPVERALSNYFFSVQNGLETRGVEEVFLREVPAPDHDPGQVSVNPFDYVGRGLYAKHVRAFLEVFPREQVGVFLLDELRARMGEIYAFVGADPDFPPVFPREPVNAARRGLPVPEAVRQGLAARFAAPNQDLARLLGRDLPW